MAKNKKLARRTRIRRSIRSKVQGTTSTPRLSVFRSNMHIYAQLIDDSEGHTLVASSSLEVKNESGTPIEKSTAVGKRLAEKAKAAGIESCVFDRGGYLYRGRVKAIADGAREGGLSF